MGTFTAFILVVILTIAVSVLLAYLIWLGIKYLASKGHIKTDVKSWSKKKKVRWGSLGTLAILVILFYSVVVPKYDFYTATEAEKKMDLPDDEFVINPKLRTIHAITIDAPPEEVWKWLVQIGGSKAGWYSMTWAENLFGLGVYNKYEVRPEWQDMEVGDLLVYNAKGHCGNITDVVPGKYFVNRWDTRKSDADWGEYFYASTGKTVKMKHWKIFPKGWKNTENLATSVYYIEELPDGKSRLISRFNLTWKSRNPIWDLGLKASFPIMHTLMDLEMCKQLKDCAEGNASKYKNTKLPKGGIH